MTLPRHILVDADACPVKEEIFKVVYRTGVPVTLVANMPLRLPRHALIQFELVSDGFDAADDLIAERAAPGTIVITADILLADRALKAGALALRPNGKPLTPDSIGGAVATRAIMADLRGGLEQVGGPPPFTKADRSRFLSSLDDMLVRLKRQGHG